MRKIRVLVVDDHPIVRDGVCSLLGLTPDIEVIGEAASGAEVLEAVRKLMPDVVLMDTAMPIMSGLEATRRLRKEFPGVKVLAFSQYDDKEYVLPAISAGACGFISKTAAVSELALAIRSCSRGDSYLSPSVAGLLVRNYQEAISVAKNDPYEQLTDRERQILKLLADGHTTQEIADMLVLSAKTVEGHKNNLMAKLDIHSRTDLIKYALRKGISTI
ncbi:MAG: response regulator transcription factor [Chloroflexi bacterium]|nr:response regulator transcription factor [Chloroflexota bacterium]